MRAQQQSQCAGLEGRQSTSTELWLFSLGSLLLLAHQLGNDSI